MRLSKRSHASRILLYCCVAVLELVSAVFRAEATQSSLSSLPGARATWVAPPSVGAGSATPGGSGSASEPVPGQVEFARLALLSLAFVVALYSFFAKEPRLREGADSLLLVIFVFGVAALLSGVSLATLVGKARGIGRACWSGSICLFTAGWLLLLANFWKLYGRLYHMRERRFWKYMRPFIWITDRRSKRYVENMRPRQSFSLRTYQLSKAELCVIQNGYVFLVTGEPGCNLSRVAIDLLVDGFQLEETGDYVTCHRPPDLVWNEVVEVCPSVKMSKVSGPSIVDAFSPNFGYNDEVLRRAIDNLTSEEGGYGVTIIPARTLAAIHSASSTSWYIAKKKAEGKGPRKPHRMVYDRLSALSPFGSVEQISNFILHFMAAERGYGMITVVVEPSDSPALVLSSATAAADCIVECRSVGGRMQSRMRRGRLLDIVQHGEWREYSLP